MQMKNRSRLAVANPGAFDLESATLVAYLWPTTPLGGWQGILGNWDATTGHGYCLCVDDTGVLSLLLGDGLGRQSICLGVPMSERHCRSSIMTTSAPIACWCDRIRRTERG